MKQLITVLLSLAVALLLVACSGEERTSELDAGDTGEQDAGGDVAIPSAPGGVVLGVASGQVESESFSGRITWSAPFAAPAAQSESLVTQPGIEVLGTDREESP